MMETTSNVRLISLTKPYCYACSAGIRGHCSAHQRQDGGNTEDLIAKIARVSNPTNANNSETAPKLLRYLIKNKHWSPFELVSFTVQIDTSRAIAQQILRHRSFTFQEFSQRYAKATEFIEYPARRQDNKNRQNSIDDLPAGVQSLFQDTQKGVNALAED